MTETPEFEWVSDGDRESLKLLVKMPQVRQHLPALLYSVLTGLLYPPQPWQVKGMSGLELNVDRQAMTLRDTKERY